LINTAAHGIFGGVQTKHLGWHLDLTWLGAAGRTWLSTAGWTYEAGRNLARKYSVFYIGRPLAVADIL